MIWLLLLGGAAVAWAWKTGRLRHLRFGDVAAIAAALAALRMFGRGNSIPALLALAGAAWWLWFRGRDRRADAIDVPEARNVAEARALLELPPDADAHAIESAHRRLIARVHPDAGGSAELARRVNAARDTLLSELRHRS